MERFPCTLRELPPELAAESIRIATEHNPSNAVRSHGLRALGIVDPQSIALLTSKYWGSKGVDLAVKFLDTSNTTLKNKILSYANKWGQYGNIQFRETGGAGDVRLSTGAGGYWSYLGTDIRSVPAGQETLNLEGFSTSTPDSEYDRVVCHEFGHTLGFPHEHERAEVLALLDVEKTVAWFAANVGWDRQTVMEQVFSPIDPATIQATAADVRSIMCYQFPGACTKSGQPIPGGNAIDPTDGAFAAKEYPKAVVPPGPGPTSTGKLHIGGSIFLDLSDGKVGTIGTIGGTSKVLTPLSQEDFEAAGEKLGLTIPPEVLALVGKYGPVILNVLIPDLFLVYAHMKTWEQVIADVEAAVASGRAFQWGFGV